MFFVLSTGRSGTQTVARALSHLPGCLCLHEPEPKLIEESPAYRYRQVDPEEIRRVLRETRSPKVGRAVYGESNQTLALLVPELVHVFPQARFIWLLRNGLDVVASIVGRGWFPAKQADWDALDGVRKYWVSYRIQGDLSGDVPKEQWDAMAQFERCCWYWSYINRTIERDLKQYTPSAFRIMRLERIDAELLHVARWLNIPALILAPAKKHNRAIDDIYTWQCWTASERQSFLLWCGDQMDIFYPEWRGESGEWTGVKYSGPSTAQRVLGVVPPITAGLNWLYSVALRVVGVDGISRRNRSRSAH